MIPIMRSMKVLNESMAHSDSDHRKPPPWSVDDYPMDSEPDSKPVSNDRPPLHSDFESDPDFKDLVVLFVDELGNRVDSIRQAFVEEDVAALCRIAHQLKGSAGGYGFDPIGDSASRLEHELLGDEAAISSLSERVEDLIANCRAAVRPDQRSEEH